MSDEYIKKCAKMFSIAICRVITDDKLSDEKRVEYLRKIDYYIDYRTKFGRGVIGK